MLAHIAAAALDVVGLQRFRIVREGRLDAAGDVRPIDRQHGLDVAVVRSANGQRRRNGGVQTHGG